MAGKITPVDLMFWFGEVNLFDKDEPTLED